MAFLALGDVVAARCFRPAGSPRATALYVWGILAGSAVGLLASTLGRLYSSTYYALRDTRTPLRYAVLRVVLTTVLGYLFAIPLPRALGLDADVGRRGADGVGRRRRLGRDAAAAIDAERAHRRTRACRVGYVATLWGSAAAGAAVGWALKLAMPALHPIVIAAIVLGAYGVIYIGATIVLRVPEASTALARLARMKR